MIFYILWLGLGAILAIAWLAIAHQIKIPDFKTNMAIGLVVAALIYVGFALYGDTTAIATKEIVWAVPICLIALTSRSLSRELAWYVLAMEDLCYSTRHSLPAVGINVLSKEGDLPPLFGHMHNWIRHLSYLSSG